MLWRSCTYLILLATLANIALCFINHHLRFKNLNDPSTSRLFSNSMPKSKTKVGRPQRKSILEDPDPFGRVSVYCIGDSINIKALRNDTSRRSVNSKGITYTVQKSVINENEVLHMSNAPLFINLDTTSVSNMVVSIDQDSSREWLQEWSALDNDDINIANNGWEVQEETLMTTQDIFYFDYGTIVFWGLTVQEERAALAELTPFAGGNVTKEELDESFDTMEYVYDKKGSPQRPIRSERLRLSSLRQEEKLAFSYAMAQSSKLFVFETKVLNAVEATRYLPRELSINGRITLSKKDLNKLIGTLFVEQTEVNLFSSILDTPDFLWDDEAHLSTYKYTRSYLEVDERAALLNRRLQVIRELLDVLTAQLNDSNSTRLEWIVIWLIAIETLVGIASKLL